MKDKGFISDTAKISRYVLPYVLEKVEHPTLKHVYILLNRDYKPLGVTDRNTWVKYEDYPQHHITFSKDPATFKDVWFSPGHELVLYNDGDPSRQDYFERLERLYALGKLVNQPER